jgi:ABC-type antimicrobial peptide transport system permease subunit
VDSFQAVSDATTVESLLNDSISPRRFAVFLLATFAGAAIVLAIVGIYSLVSYSVVLQTREIGIRVVMGATRADIVGMILRRGVGLVAGGLLIGIPMALALTRTMRGLLYGITPADPITFVGAAVLLAAAALAACGVPALKAASVRPAVALRSE